MSVPPPPNGPELLAPNSETTPQTAVAEGFEPPDGFSRLSLSRRVH